MRWNKLGELTASERRVIIAALSIIGALAIHNWLVSPHVASLRASQRYERATGMTRNESEAVGHKLQAKRQDLERLLAEQAVLAEGVFHPAEAERFFNELEPLCVTNRCTVNSFNHADRDDPIRRGVSDDNTPVSRKTATLTLQASYGNTVRLMEKLQAYPRKVWIDKLKISSTPTASGAICQLEISIYVHRDKENEGHE